MNGEGAEFEKLVRDGAGLSKQEIEELLRKFEELEADVKGLAEKVDPHVENRLRKLAGAHYDTMLVDKEKTTAFIAHPDPSIREAAVQLAYQHWEIKDELSAKYEELALSDPSEGVREVAISALGRVYSRTKDARIGRLLAGIVRGEETGEQSRLTAFVSLLLIHGMSDYTGPAPPVPTSLDEIDWAFVDLYDPGR